MTKAKYTPEERKKIKAENLKRNIEKAKEKGYVGNKNLAREEAKLRGDKKYIHHSPCKVCGSYERYVSSFGCVPCNVEKGLEKLNNKELMEPYRTKEKQSKNREKRREALRKNNKKYYKTEKGKIASTKSSAKRRAAKINQTPKLTIEENQKISDIYKKCVELSLTTGIPHEVDHIIPLSKGGLHHPNNLQILTMEENQKKGDRT